MRPNFKLKIIKNISDEDPKIKKKTAKNHCFTTITTAKLVRNNPLTAAVDSCNVAEARKLVGIYILF